MPAFQWFDRPVWRLMTLRSCRFNPGVWCRRIAFVVNPIFGLALALILSIWFAAFWQHRSEHAANHTVVSIDAKTFAHMIEQNVERTANSLDSVLKFMRASYQRKGSNFSWPALVVEAHKIAGVAVQLAVIDARGIMITSSAMPYPAKSIDLSDREHFRLLRAGYDHLFVSRPLIGRASGKQTVQFTRRLQEPDGTFAGVLVASLTTEYLTNAFGSVAQGDGNGIALYGTDGIIRAGAGIFAGLVGEHILQAEINDIPSASLAPVSELFVSKSQHKAVATIPVEGFPLLLRVVRHNVKAEQLERSRLVFYLLGAGAATLCILYFATASNLSRQKYESRIIQLAHFDSLTGLHNRARFRDALAHAFMSRRGAERFALLLFDLDGFKTINDVHGHPVGDQILQGVAKRARTLIGANDLIARVGGDEFAIIQHSIASKEDAAALAQRICTALADPFVVSNYKLSIGVSVGIAMAGDGPDVASMLKAADLALYAAKAAGRGTHYFFDPAIGLAYQNRRAIARDLQSALAAEQFELHYQPIVDTLTGDIRGFEALVRWRHPVKGLIPPNDFILIAEETGLIVPLGDWILERACRDIARYSSSQSISVNCSPLQLKVVDFADKVKATLRREGLDPRRLKLEITESILLTRDGPTLACLDALKALGVGLALDDFGTGYSSLSYVMSYPFTQLKIDRSFTSKLCENERGISVARAMCAMAASLELETVAEGVETVEQLEQLRALGCTMAQGYLFSKPRPASEILACAPDAAGLGGTSAILPDARAMRIAEHGAVDADAVAQRDAA